MRDKPYSRKSFLRHALVNAGGIAAGQLIVLLATPVLARMYTPAEFGVYASLIAICGVIATGAALRLDKALPAAQDGEIPTIYRLGILGCVAILTLGVFAVGFGAQRYLPWPQPLAPMALAMLCIATGALQALMAMSGAALVRRGAFLPLAIQRMAQPACFVAAALLSVPGGLPAAFTIGLIAAALSGFVFTWRELVAQSQVRAIAVARKYWEYPAVSLPMAVLDTLTLSLPLLFIVQHYGDAAGGNYSQVQRLAAAPLLLLANAISQVFYKHAGDVARAGQSPRALMWRTVRGLVLAGALIIALVALAGEPVLSLFLGKGWRTDSHYLLLVLLPAVFRVSVSPITSIFLVMEQVRFGALWQMIYAASTWGVLSFASGRLSLDGLLLAVLLNELVLYGLYLWMADIAVRRGERKVIECAA